MARSAYLVPIDDDRTREEAGMTAPPNGVASQTVRGPVPLVRSRKVETLWSESWRRFRKHRLATVGMVVLLVMVAAVLVGPVVYRVPIDEIDFKAKLKGPSWAHPLGTDDLGQDLLARMLYGGRISLAVGVAAMLIAVSVGTLVGAAAGQMGGTVDHALMRLTDLFISLPGLPLLLLLVYLFRDTLKKMLGPEMGVFILVVAVIGGLRWMLVARLVRAQFLSLREKEFVEAARGLGAPPLRQIVRHVLPNAMGPVIVAGTIDVAAAIIAESSLSFLGLGFPPDIPSWGRILYDAKDNLDFAPHWGIFPGTAIFLAVLSINYIGDGLRDALDPRRVLS
jgi:peptide/nickel transport system permease protein